MDGNNRWSKNNSKSKYEAYKFGANKLLKLSSYIFENTDVKYVSAFALSNYNLNRSKKLLNVIKKILLEALNDFLTKDSKFNVRFIGDFDFLDKTIQSKIFSINKNNSNNKELIIYLNYGGKEDILQSVLKSNNKYNFEKNLLTYKIPDPEILIRTGGYKRISNFLLYQIAFTELFFIKKLWPDLAIKDLNNIFKNYHTIERKFGR